MPLFVQIVAACAHFTALFIFDKRVITLLNIKILLKQKLCIKSLNKSVCGRVVNVPHDGRILSWIIL